MRSWLQLRQAAPEATAGAKMAQEAASPKTAEGGEMAPEAAVRSTRGSC